jgi:hypothetical protein
VIPGSLLLAKVGSEKKLRDGDMGELLDTSALRGSPGGQEYPQERRV